MPKAIAMDLRVKIVAYAEAGHSFRLTANHFNVSDTFVAKLLKNYRETGVIDPGWQGRDKSPRLAALEDFLTQTVDAEPYISMPTLSQKVFQARGVKVASGTLSQYLINLGYKFQPGLRSRGVRGRFRTAPTGSTRAAA